MAEILGNEAQEPDGPGGANAQTEPVFGQAEEKNEGWELLREFEQDLEQERLHETYANWLEARAGSIELKGGDRTDVLGSLDYSKLLN